MGLLAGWLLGIVVGSAPSQAEATDGNPVVAVAPTGIPGSGFRLVASDPPSWSSALGGVEALGDDDEGTREFDGFLMLPSAGRVPGAVGPAGPIDPAGAFAARVARCPLFLLLGRFVC